jgi:GNAT superfamily N-acetyltransferase
MNLDFDPKEYNFDSGVEELNNFFYKQAYQFIKEDYCQVYYTIEHERSDLISFVALAAGRIEFKNSLNLEVKIPFVPGVLVGRLATDKKYHRMGYGEDILKYSIKKSLDIAKKIGCRYLIVDAIADLNAINFYEKHEFKYLNGRDGIKFRRALEKGYEPKDRTIKMYFDLHLVKI